MRFFEFERRRSALALFAGALVLAAPLAAPAAAGQSQPGSAGTQAAGAFLDRYCVTCHNERLRTAGLSLDSLDTARPDADPEIWERVIGRLRAGSMPPPGRPRPDAATYRAVAGWLEAEIDRAWAASPSPGRIGAIHRLNRTEYANAVRDLLAIGPDSFDVRPLLPGDETADGSFDNFAGVLTVSRAHLERYLSVARQLTRLATGLPPAAPGIETFEIPLHIVQDERQSEDLPFGSRGGIAVSYHFPVDGEYLLKVRLRRQYQDYIMGMGWPQQLDDAPRWQAAEAVHRRRERGRGPAGRGQLRRRRPTRICRRSRAGKSTCRSAGDAAAGDPCEGRSGAPRRRRVVREGAVGARRASRSPCNEAGCLTNDQIYMDYAAVGSVRNRRPVSEVSGNRLHGHPQPSQAIFVCTTPEPGHGRAGGVPSEDSVGRSPGGPIVDL